MRLGVGLSILILGGVEHVFEILSLRVVSYITHRGGIFNDLDGSSYSLIIGGESRGSMMK